MSEEPNPYAPSVANEWPVPVAVGRGSDWKLERESLWVRDGAVLPDICLVSGETATRGRRVLLPLALPPLRKLHGQRIQVSAFRSYAGVVKDIGCLLGGPVVGTLAAVACTEWMIGDGSATAASISASVGLFALGIVYSGIHAKKALQIVASRDGWHELRGVHPSVIEHLSNFPAAPGGPSQKIAGPSSP